MAKGKVIEFVVCGDMTKENAKAVVEALAITMALTFPDLHTSFTGNCMSTTVWNAITPVGNDFTFNNKLLEKRHQKVLRKLRNARKGG